MKVIVLTLCFFIALITSANAGEMYKCIDLNGNTIATDNPQDGMKCVSKDNEIESKTASVARTTKKKDRLIQAAGKGNLPEVQAALADGAYIDAMSIKKDYFSIFPRKATALMMASEKGHTEVVKLLLDKGADVNVKDDYGVTALMMASEGGYIEIVKLLLNKGAYVNIKVAEVGTALMVASGLGHTEVVKLLLDKGADVNSKNKKGDNALMIAKKKGRIDIVKILERAGTSTSVLRTTKIDLVDKRKAEEREGRPYPNSWFSYTMHGDRSLNVDRLSILKAKLLERFGSKLEEKDIVLTKFSVMEATVKPSFYKTPSGKQIPNPGPAVPTLISEITLSVDGNYYRGSYKLPLPQGSKSTESTLTVATTKVVDDLLIDMERGERSWNH